MRFLANMGISPRTVEWLRSQGHDAVRLREIGLQRATDAEVTARALAEGRIVLTMDRDYGQLLAESGQCAPSVVLFRLSREQPTFVNERLAAVLARHSGALDSGAIVSVGDKTIRMRLLPILDPGEGD